MSTCVFAIRRLGGRFLLASLAGLGAACAEEVDAGSRSTGATGLAPVMGVPQKEVIEFEDAKFLIEHNATAEDTGFQGFLDGEPWSSVTLSTPDGRNVLNVRAQRELKDLGLTELFFETDEPENAEVPIAEMLATFPEGEYRFVGTSVDGIRMQGTALLTHDVPAAPVITSPQPEAVVDPDQLVVRWNAVDETITGGDVTIVAYQVIVEKEVEEDPFPDAFANLVLSAHVPPSVTSLTVPREFLQQGTAYKVEILAIEESGNQTITESTFETE